MSTRLTPNNYGLLQKFVEIVHRRNLRFQNVHIKQSDDNLDGLYFDIQNEIGLTEDEVKAIFGPLIEQCPTCGIGYNKRDATVLEKTLLRTN